MKKVTSTTMFYRNIPQLYTIFDLCDIFQEEVKIHFWGCSIGCEPYSFLIDYMARGCPFGLDIKGLDYNDENIERAKKGVFDFEPKGSEYNFIRDTYKDGFPIEIPQYAKKFFKKTSSVYSIKTTHPITFKCKDLLLEKDVVSLGKAHINIAQNMLIHLSDKQAYLALENLYKNTLDGGYLVIGGTDHDVLSEFTQKNNLKPIMKNFNIIYDSFIQRKAKKIKYFHMEDIDKTKRDWRYRYCTIFKK